MSHTSDTVHYILGNARKKQYKHFLNDVKKKVFIIFTIINYITYISLSYISCMDTDRKRRKGLLNWTLYDFPYIAFSNTVHCINRHVRAL